MGQTSGAALHGPPAALPPSAAIRRWRAGCSTICSLAVLGWCLMMGRKGPQPQGAMATNERSSCS